MSMPWQERAVSETHACWRLQRLRIMERLHRLAGRMTQWTRIWARVIRLVWETSPLSVTKTLLMMCVSAIIPSLKILTTKLIIENVAVAIQSRQANDAARLAILF